MIYDETLYDSANSSQAIRKKLKFLILVFIYYMHGQKVYIFEERNIIMKFWNFIFI